MASAISYYDLSFRRFCDVTALIIEDLLFRGFCSRLDNASRKQFRAIAKERAGGIASLLAENPKVEGKRAKLNGQMESLQKIYNEIKWINPVKDDEQDPLLRALVGEKSEQELSRVTSDSGSPAKRDSPSSSSPPAKLTKKKKKKGWF